MTDRSTMTADRFLFWKMIPRAVFLTSWPP